LKVVIGLGNPGVRYQFTRHNIGFMAVEYFANVLGIGFKRIKSYHSMIARGTFNHQKILIVQPQTYMNLSGKAVKKITSYYKIPHSDLLVVYDDLSLNLGQMRIRTKGSSGGHNGIESIIQYMGAEDIPRLRLGIGKIPVESGIEQSAYVLSRFKKDEREKLDKIVAFSSDAIKSILINGFDEAMREYNKKIECNSKS